MNMVFQEVKKLTPPLRAPDMEDCGHLYWFNEMFAMMIKSNLNREPALLAECPLSHKLMYCNGDYPLGWYILGSNKVQEAYAIQQFEDIVLV